jgi:hypothetical protein
MPTTGQPPRRSGQLRARWTILALTCAVLLTGSSCVLLDFPQTAGNRTLRTIVTFYAAYDNDPPGTTTIAFPNPRHAHAGGTGTADDPVTLASAPAVVAVGTTIYYPPLRKYFVMEDLCETCVARWDSTRTPHIDLWVGAGTDARVLACEEALTPDGPVAVEVDPPRDRPVDTTPLYGDGRSITR